MIDADELEDLFAIDTELRASTDSQDSDLFSLLPPILKPLSNSFSTESYPSSSDDVNLDNGFNLDIDFNLGKDLLSFNYTQLNQQNSSNISSLPGSQPIDKDEIPNSAKQTLIPGQNAGKILENKKDSVDALVFMAGNSTTLTLSMKSATSVPLPKPPTSNNQLQSNQQHQMQAPNNTPLTMPPEQNIGSSSQNANPLHMLNPQSINNNVLFNNVNPNVLSFAANQQNIILHNQSIVFWYTYYINLKKLIISNESMLSSLVKKYLMVNIDMHLNYLQSIYLFTMPPVTNCTFIMQYPNHINYHNNINNNSNSNSSNNIKSNAVQQDSESLAPEVQEPKIKKRKINKD